MNELTVFVVVRAASHEAAAKMFERHPHFSTFPCDCVEVLPVVGPPEGGEGQSAKPTKHIAFRTSEERREAPRPRGRTAEGQQMGRWLSIGSTDMHNVWKVVRRST